MTMHKFTMNALDADRVHKLVAGHTEALKNWIVSAVEDSDLVRAQKLAVELRHYQGLYRAFNLPAKAEAAGRSGREMCTEHAVVS